MKTLQIANANFELELERSDQLSLEASLEQHPLLLQLQFLPLISSGPDETLLVTQRPEKGELQQLLSLGLQRGETKRSEAELPTLIPLATQDPIDCQQLVSWGYSEKVAAWAKSHQIGYPTPLWETTKLVNSKLFSFAQSPKLPHAQLLEDEPALRRWLQENEKPLVLKSAFGFSARGNLILKEQLNWNHLLAFCSKEWTQGRPLIGEPWMDRTADFSTQWFIASDGTIHFIGAARITNDAKGAYQSTLTGPEPILFADLSHFLRQHKEAVIPVLQQIFRQGYFGPIGVDAMVYRKEDTLHLHPIVEINARQTMSLHAIRFQRRWFPDRVVKLSYTKRQEGRLGLLPTQLKTGDGHLIAFTRQLYYQIER
jgi:hypothetical protein